MGWAIVKQSLDSHTLQEVILPIKNINKLNVKITDHFITPLTIIVVLTLLVGLAVIAFKDFGIKLPADAFKWDPMGRK